MLHAPILLSILSKALIYLDPGSGSLALQILIATLLGGALLLRKFWTRIFHRDADPKDEASDENVHDISKDE